MSRRGRGRRPPQDNLERLLQNHPPQDNLPQGPEIPRSFPTVHQNGYSQIMSAADVHSHPDYQALEMRAAEMEAQFSAFVQNAQQAVPLHVTLVINPLSGMFSYTYTDGLLPHIEAVLGVEMPRVAKALTDAVYAGPPQAAEVEVYDPRQPRNPLTHPLGSQ